MLAEFLVFGLTSLKYAVVVVVRLIRRGLLISEEGAILPVPGALSSGLPIIHETMSESTGRLGHVELLAHLYTLADSLLLSTHLPGQAGSEQAVVTVDGSALEVSQVLPLRHTLPQRRHFLPAHPGLSELEWLCLGRSRSRPVEGELHELLLHSLWDALLLGRLHLGFVVGV